MPNNSAINEDTQIKSLSQIFKKYFNLKTNCGQISSDENNENMAILHILKMKKKLVSFMRDFSFIGQLNRKSKYLTHTIFLHTLPENF